MIMPNYPHMMAEDTEVWTKYLKNPIAPIKEVWYDLHVGSPLELKPWASKIEKQIAAGVYRKRIDVVAHVGGGYWVIEVKPIAKMNALGQAIAYARLFAVEFSPPGEVVPVVVCDHCDPDLLDDFENAGVGVIEVGEEEVTISHF